MMRAKLEKAVADGYLLQIAKYRSNGEWSAWKMVSLEKALEKLSVWVSDGCSDFQPYKVRIVFEYNGELVER
jgi:hypothetical protein